MLRLVFHSFLLNLLLVQIRGQETSGLRCVTGSSVYSPNQTIFYVDLNAMVEVCKPGQDCAKYSWINTDTAGLMSFTESGFCADEDDTVDCALLPSFPGVGEVENCSTTRCSTDKCNHFLSPVCNLGSVAYVNNQTLAVLVHDVKKENCQIGESCGMYRWMNTDADGYESYVEYGTCEGPNRNNDCDILPDLPGVGEVNNCSFEYCTGNECEEFRIKFPEDRGFICSRGTVVFSADRSRVVTKDDIVDQPCAQWDACAMYRWINTDDNGARNYVESGFCLSLLQLTSFSCGTLPQYQDVGEVEDCSFDVCSGDNCLPFTIASGTATLVAPNFIISAFLFITTLMQLLAF